MSTLDIKSKWSDIRRHFSKSFFSSLHYSIAYINERNEPAITPIGTVFLNEDQSGFYFEKFSRQLPLYAQDHREICVLAVNSSKRFWLRSLFKGYFIGHPAIRLYGRLGPLREALDSEIYALHRRMRFTKRLKGHKMLWKDMTMVREIDFKRAEKMSISSMTQNL